MHDLNNLKITQENTDEAFCNFMALIYGNGAANTAFIKMGLNNVAKLAENGDENSIEIIKRCFGVFNLFEYLVKQNTKNLDIF